jgi:hypothetical protein
MRLWPTLRMFSFLVVLWGGVLDQGARADEGYCFNGWTTLPWCYQAGYPFYGKCNHQDAVCGSGCWDPEPYECWGDGGHLACTCLYSS